MIHGLRVADPYRWLEDSDSEEVKQWTALQNAYTRSILDAYPGRAQLRQEIAELKRIGWEGRPVLASRRERDGRHTRYFHARRRPQDDQPILVVRDSLDGPDRTLVDPNALSADKTAALDWWFPSWEGRYVAYGISRGGDEQSTLYVLDVDNGKTLPETEVITRTRHASVAWLSDSSGFYYSRYPEKGTVPDGEEHYHRRIYLHRMGRSPEDDPMVFGQGRKMTDSPYVAIAPGGRWLVAMVHQGWSRTEAHLMDLKDGATAGWLPLAVPQHDAIYLVEPFDDFLLVQTNDGAPNYEVYRVDPAWPERRDWTRVVPEQSDALEGVCQIGDQIFATYIHHARSLIRRYGADGTPQGEIALPGLGTASPVAGEHDGTEGFVSFRSFTVPSQVYRVDAATGETSLWAEASSPVEPSLYSVEQRWSTSPDGTRVPMFVVRRKGMTQEGPAPTLLAGYGGFNISRMPTFAEEVFALLRRGGVYVSVNLRGGSEYGEKWHRAGMLRFKQNVFDDFIAAAETLIREGVTSPERLGILGGSNGGLLVGAAITQRPELFRAAVAAVPLLDMVRYHHFLIAKLWVPEYGDPENPEHFRWLYAYSPYHHVEQGVAYPATLLLTAVGDSRVDPMHARKMAPLLQQATSSERPILLRVETKAGHGAGKPVSKRIDERLDMVTFLFQQLGVAM